MRVTLVAKQRGQYPWGQSTIGGEGRWQLPWCDYIGSKLVLLRGGRGRPWTRLGTFCVGRPLAPNSIFVAEQVSTLLQDGAADVRSLDCVINEEIWSKRRRKSEGRTWRRGGWLGHHWGLDNIGSCGWCWIWDHGNDAIVITRHWFPQAVQLLSMIDEISNDVKSKQTEWKFSHENE